MSSLKQKFLKQFFAALFLMVVGFSFSPLPVSANANGCEATDNTTYCLLAPLPGMGDETGKVDVQSGFGTYLNTIITLLFGLIGVLAVVMVTVGGIEYMSTVSMGEKEGAKSRITNAILGLLLALSSYLILKTINPALVDTDIGIDGVSLDYKGLNLTSDFGQPFPTGTKGISDGNTAGNANGVTDVKSNNTDYDKTLQKAAAAHGVDCTWMKATMYRESNGKPGAVSKAGAVGLMQMMPGTWRGLGYTDQSKWKDPDYAADASAKYMSQLKKTGCNTTAASTTSDCNMLQNNYINGYMAAAYNGGPGANAPAKDCVGKTKWECTVNQGGLVETQKYAELVTNNYQTLKKNGWGC